MENTIAIINKKSFCNFVEKCSKKQPIYVTVGVILPFFSIFGLCSLRSTSYNCIEFEQFSGFEDRFSNLVTTRPLLGCTTRR